ncbi:hypothetical protein PQ472_07670 [Lacticaseibacillus pabuli]|uniref:Bacteriophage SP-beta YorD domain-containing protein n=1 Tax=Lacticaseibacillus pabuli TaxID=3025672 RepID=A0ABY7WS20_9LACO|nr:hypothetical protein [Lacticaseibacillus sp. KACC 23028]WDF81802.1 hypothetical protein PQ472_07670 [Lacticaseibacillus sp. KACC 23028]
MTERKTFHQFPQPLKNGLYIAEGTEDDQGQTLSNPVFWQDEVAAKPADFDTVPYQITLNRTWQQYTVEAQSQRAAQAEADAKQAQADAKQAQADADAAKQTAMQLLMAQAQSLPDKGAETGADTSNESTSSTPNTDTSSTTTPDTPTDSAENKEA